MNLPSIELQILYGRLAWAVVLVALGLVVFSRRFAGSWSGIATLVGTAAALALLPEHGSPVHWLGLAFQSPSVTSVGLCLFALFGRRTGGDLLPTVPATLVVLTGALLYLDASGWISIGLYFAGLSPQGAPIAAFALAVFCMAATVFNRWRQPALALFSASVAYMVLRLPTGNLWDSLLDPFLWLYAFAVMVRATWNALSASSRSNAQANAN